MCILFFHSLFFSWGLNSLKDSTTTRPFKRELKSSVLAELKYLFWKYPCFHLFLVTYLHQSCADPEKKIQEREGVDKVCLWGRRSPSSIFGYLSSLRYLIIQSRPGPTHQWKSPLWCNQWCPSIGSTESGCRYTIRFCPCHVRQR